MTPPTGVALVTGAAGGIGQAVTRLLLAEGYAVGALDRDQDALAALVAQTAPEHRDRLLAAPADVAAPGDVEQALALVEAGLGPVTHAVLAAGVLRPATLAETTDDDWDLHLGVNAGGTFRTLRALTSRLRAGGAVVVVSSNAARVPRQGMAAYAASKAAATMLTRCAGLELAGRGIRCNIVEPGSTDTTMQRDLWPDAELGARAAVQGDPASFRVGIPLGRVADPGDVAETVTFLLSERARHITMQSLLVDGGASL